MDLRNTKPNKQLKNNNQDIIFQINDWQCYDEVPDDSDLDEDVDNSKYVINIFGINEKNESISVRVTDFQPRFYVNIPKS